MTTHLTGPHCGGNGRGRRSLRRSCRPSSLSMTTQCDSKWHPSQQWNCWRLLITGVNPQRRRAAQTPACSLCRVTLIIMWQTAPRVSDVTAEPHPNDDESVAKALRPNFVAAIQVSNILQLRCLRLHFKGPKWLLIYSLWFPGARHT